MIPKSAVSEVLWPALPSAHGAALLALQQQLDESERLPGGEVERRQFAALGGLLRHAVDTVPYYRATAGYSEVAEKAELTAAEWRRLPILTRAALQEAGDAVRSERVPPDHLPVAEVITTGSTGRPVRAAVTRVTGAMWVAITLREARWHRRDLTARLAALRADPAGTMPAEGLELPHWEANIAAAYAMGPCSVLSIAHDVGAQAEWLVARDPEYVLSYASNLVAIADHLRSAGAKLGNLREAITYGEVVTDEARAALREAWGVPVVDMYSSQEVGYLALQCPAGEQYHVQSEVVYLEVLDDSDQPCEPGEVGRVVVSPLHNYATPLLRYEIGDYAEVGDDRCECGRTLPVLRRIMGRQRNIWTLPNGDKVWPMFSSRKWGHIDAIRQLQLVQHTVDHIEAKVVGPRPLTVAEEAELTALLRGQFQFPFELTLTCLDQIDRSKGLKFEDFVSHVSQVRA